MQAHGCQLGAQSRDLGLLCVTRAHYIPQTRCRGAYAFGAFVAAVYACLSFSLLVACVSGIGSLVVQRFPMVDPVAAHAAFPCFVGAVIGFFPFTAIDTTNRVLSYLLVPHFIKVW